MKLVRFEDEYRMETYVNADQVTHIHAMGESTVIHFGKSPYATFYTGGPDGFVVSTAAPIATGWSDPVPGRVFLPLWTSAFHGAL